MPRTEVRMKKNSGHVARYSALPCGGAKMTIVYLILSIATVLRAATAEAQPAKKMPRIGFLATNRTPRTEAFRQGLRDLGYVENKNILIEYRFAEGAPARLPLLAGELVHLNVEVIVTAGAAATRPAKEATVTIP